MPATKRPPLHYHSTTGKMNYMEMLFEANNNIPWWYGLLASRFTWIILAGWIVFPATFNKLQKDNDLDDKAESELERKILGSVRYVTSINFHSSSTSYAQFRTFPFRRYSTCLPPYIEVWASI
jgi:hypothetical protein